MLSTSRAHFAHIAVLDYSRQCRNNRVQAGKTRSIRSPWRAKKTRLPAADACSPNADWTAMLACFINSACLFCSASFIGPAALDAPWDSKCTEEKATTSVVGQPPKLINIWSKLPLYSKYFKLDERKENCLWNSLCNVNLCYHELLVLFSFLRMSIFHSIFFCKASDSKDKSWCAAQI
ncbi:retinoblastoma-binding protein 6 [Trichinella spiralis]|uniref:retinoblastoma-binding protein 6 n=1 Tax=Trichinella spiralis TaxID=6334 RepID=UPI0001EFD0BD|nr:retinoblastoma-binding protein 6 [Trichinella spiralis]